MIGVTDEAVIARSDDLSACARERIHEPGSIQPHGALFVIDPGDGSIVQAAIGPGVMAFVGPDALGRKLADILPSEAAPLLDRLGVLPAIGAEHLGFIRHGDAGYHLIGHRSGGRIVLELEQAVGREPGSFDEIYPDVRAFLDAVQRTGSISDLADLAAREVRRITGLDRALIYRFDADWHGEVIAEDRNERLPSYKDLRFPASDIPPQARDLYRINRLRLIADAQYQPVPIVPDHDPVTAAPVDLTYSVLRSVSPVHCEYMRNMGTMASMSMSLLVRGELWGLISCHHADARRVPYHIRAACEFIGQVVSMQIGALNASALADRRHALRGVQGRLLAHMAAADHFLDGLLSHGDDLLALTSATGAAVMMGDSCARIGDAPAESEIRTLVGWMASEGRQDLFVTDSLAAHWSDGEAIREDASGVLAISISQVHDSYLLWFRPEWVRTISWGGNPAKRAELGADGIRLHPRTSFEAWEEEVRLRSRPWHEAEVDAASELRVAIVDIVLRRAEELAALSERLAAINKELEAFSYSVSHDLRAPFRHIVGYAELLKKFEGGQLSERGNRYVDTIVDSALSAGRLVDDLLSYSQMGRSTMTLIPVDMERLVTDVRKGLTIDKNDANVDWRIGKLEPVRADPTMIRLVLQNLLENALKFTGEREKALIEIGSETRDGEVLTWVRDNGAGFDMAYVGKLFGVFQRLHREEEFEGTGIGLANVKRIVERHGGRVWAEGKSGEGATFSFTLPMKGGDLDIG